MYQTNSNVCPICNNYRSSGRCSCSLSDRTKGAFAVQKAVGDKNKGRIDITELTKTVHSIRRR
jgi:hypothetical protein